MKQAVPHGLNQSCADIELLIACSGATTDVLSVAHKFAEADNRVHVLDLPASPVRTTTARATALSRARSDRIFILQDDDIWGPKHVETLGGMLEESDFASSLTLAATLSGQLVAWPCAFNSHRYRQGYKNGSPKLIYEAHYAFRRSTYERLNIRWENLSGKGLARHLLDCFVIAGSSVRWSSTDEPTAISLNSPPRVLFSIAQRASEMAKLGQRVSQLDTFADLPRTANFVTCFVRLLQSGHIERSEDLEAALSQTGITISSTSIEECADKLCVSLDDGQVRSLTAAFKLHNGQRVDLETAALICLDLIENYEAYELNFHTMNALFLSCYDEEEIASILLLAIKRERNVHRKAYALLALSHLCLQHQDIAAAREYANEASVQSQLVVQSTPTVSAALAIAENRMADVRAILEPVIMKSIATPAQYLQLFEALTVLGERAAARRVYDHFLTVHPSSPLRSEIEKTIN